MEEQKGGELPGNVYLFLNEEEQLRKMALKEDWTKNAGEGKSIAFQHHVLGAGDSFLGELTGGSSFSYSVGGTGNGEFPVQGKNGRLNIKVREQGFNTQFLEKSSSAAGSGTGIVDVWKGPESNLLVLGEKENSSHVLLWNGKAFKARKAIVKNKGGKVVLENSLWHYLSAIRSVSGNQSQGRENPQKVYLKYNYYDGKKQVQEEKTSIAACEFPLKDEDREKLAINFSWQDPEKIREEISMGTKILKDVELKIKWWGWAKEVEGIRDGLERMSRDFIGADFDKTTFPNLFQHRKLGADDFREEILGYINLISEKFPEEVAKDPKVPLKPSDEFLFIPLFSWEGFIDKLDEEDEDDDEREERSGRERRRAREKRQEPNAEMSADDFVQTIDKFITSIDDRFKQGGQWPRKVSEKAKEFTSKVRFQFTGEKGKRLWDLAKRQPENARPPKDTPVKLEKDRKKLVAGIKKRQETLKILASSEGSGVPPGVYNIVLVFDGASEAAPDRERDLVIWSKEGKSLR